MGQRPPGDDRPPGPPAGLSGTFWRFWSAGALSNLGDGVRLTALPLLVATLTRRPFPVSMVTAATMIPWAVVGPFGGALVDRHDRRRIIITGQTLRGVAVAVLAVLVATGHTSLTAIYVVAATIGLGEVFVDSAMQAAIPKLASPSQLEQANSKMVAAEVATNDVVGGPLGAALFVAAAWLPFALDAASFLVGALLVSTVHATLQDRRDPAQRRSLRSEVGEGLRFTFGHPFLRGVAISVACFNGGMTAAASVSVLFVLDVLHSTERAFGWMTGIGAVGGLVGAIAAAPVVRRVGRRRMLVGCSVATTAAFGLLGVAGNVVVATALMFVAIGFSSAYNVVGRSARQSVTPDHLLGRVIASVRVIGLGAIPVGAAIGGLIATWIGVRATFGFAAVLGVVGSAVLSRAVRWLADSPAAPTDPSADPAATA